MAPRSTASRNGFRRSAIQCPPTFSNERSWFQLGKRKKVQGGVRRFVFGGRSLASSQTRTARAGQQGSPSQSGCGAIPMEPTPSGPISSSADERGEPQAGRNGSFEQEH